MSGEAFGRAKKTTIASSSFAFVGLLLLTSSDVAMAREGDGKGSSLPIQTTLDDFHQHGTQPLGAGVPGSFAPVIGSIDCYACHSNYGPQDPFLMVEEFNTWAGSMMGQSARDPIFWAMLSVTNQASAESGVFCIRCHAPVAFLNGHATADGSQMTGHDFEGVSCNFCHRVVDPVYVAGTSPPQDEQLLGDLVAAGLMPPQATNSRYIVDPTDVRRGPFNDVPLNVHTGDPIPEILHSPFHSTAEFCWTCHDVSNPLMLKQPDGKYALDSLGTPHPTGEQTQMLPLHRTYSEWKNSYYSSIGVQHDGRFGGNHPTGLMKSCQDCHMPDTEGFGCNLEFEPFFSRPDVPQHSFMGSNYWVLNAVRTVDFNGDSKPDFPDSQTFLNDEIVSKAIERNIDFLQKASDLELAKVGSDLRVRLINQTGHKLPTGFPDGRRMWINVKFFDCQENLLGEHGEYDFDTATLHGSDTEVYEIHLGIQGEAYAQSLGLPEGHTFHFMLANAIIKDNRIPPAGFANSIAQQLQTQSVGAVYFNGQNWDDTLYQVPAGTRNAVVTVYYQLTSREFIEFLRDENTTDTRGQVAYDLWVANGMSGPIAIDVAEHPFFRPEDINQDGAINVNDLLQVINGWGSCPATPAPCPADTNGDRLINVNDLLNVLNAWGSC